MKKYFCPVLIGMTFFLLHACKKVEKDPLDYYPKVKTVSAVVLSDGRVEVTGEILDPGAHAIEHAGFSMDEETVPDMLSNQVTAEVSGNIFKYTYEGLTFPNEYYFQAWAVNEYGYARGNIISLDSIQADPVVAPCTVTQNTVYNGISSTQTYFEVAAPDEYDNKWRIKAFAGNSVYYFFFKSLPATGIYTTNNSQILGPNDTQIYFDISWSGSGLVSSGALLYVNQTSQSEWTMTLCSSPWTDDNGGTHNIKTQFSCPY